MAEWINLFDLGECDVVVFRRDGTEELMFSGSMAKGDTVNFMDSEDQEYELSVSPSGEVSLDGADGISSAAYDVTVIPNYPHNYPARIRGIEFGDAVNYAHGQIAVGGANSDQRLEFTGLVPPDPDPLDMSALTGSREGVGMAFANGGIG